MSLELVIFDVDGLLLDTERVWQEVWKKTAQQFQIKDGEALFARVVGRSGQEVNEILQATLPKHCDAQQFLDVAHARGLRQIETELTIKHGGKELLTFLSLQNIKKAIATSTNRNLTMQRLKQMGIAHEFSYLCCGDDVTRRKPAPDIYQKVLCDMHISNKHALVLEDSYVGVEAAHQAGVPCIMVPDLMQPRVRETQITQYIAKDLLEVKDLLDRSLSLHTLQ